jgi:hypothetical protein
VGDHPGKRRMPSEVKLVVCESMKEEARAALSLAGLDDVEIITFSPVDERPWNDEGMLGCQVSDRLSPDDAICVVDVGCHPGRLRLPDSYRFVHTACAANTAEFVAGRTVAEQLFAEGAYVVLPGWTKDWRRYLHAKESEPSSAKRTYSSFTRVVMLQVIPGSDGVKTLHELSHYLDLEPEIVPVGLEILSLRLANGILQASLKRTADHSGGLPREVQPL